MPRPRKKPNMITRPPQQLLAGAMSEPAAEADPEDEIDIASFLAGPSMMAGSRPLGPQDSGNHAMKPHTTAHGGYWQPPQEELQNTHQAAQGVVEVCSDALYWYAQVSRRAWGFMMEVAESVQVGYTECIEDLVVEINQQLFGVDDKPHNLLATTVVGTGWITLSSSVSIEMLSYFHTLIPTTTGITLGLGCFVLGIAFLGFCYAQLRTRQHVTQVVEHQAIVLGVYFLAGWMPLMYVGVYQSGWMACKFICFADCGLLFYLNRRYALIVHEITNQADFKRADLHTCRLASQFGMGSTVIWTIILAKMLC